MGIGDYPDVAVMLVNIYFVIGFLFPALGWPLPPVVVSKDCQLLFGMCARVARLPPSRGAWLQV